MRRDFLFDDTNGLLPDDKLTIYCEVMSGYVRICQDIPYIVIIIQSIQIMDY